jgi:hypothetical protein
MVRDVTSCRIKEGDRFMHTIIVLYGSSGKKWDEGNIVERGRTGRGLCPLPSPSPDEER